MSNWEEEEGIVKLGKYGGKNKERYNASKLPMSDSIIQLAVTLAIALAAFSPDTVIL